MSSYKKTYVLPFKYEIPTYTDIFKDKHSIFGIWIKYFKRYCFIFLRGQKQLEVSRISREHRDILWINFSAPSLGDSLMDLSSRVLLSEKRVDLLSDKKNAHIYKDDNFFNAVFTEEMELSNNRYDLIILDSYSTRSISIKAKVAYYVPFVGMYGYFNGPEVNRVLFSFHRMNHLIGYPKSENEINNSAKTYISISPDDNEVINKLQLPKKFISIALGGEWSYRTFKNWCKVIQRIIVLNPNIKIALTGSSNAISYENLILENLPSNNLLSFVDRFSYKQTTQIIAKSELLLCCDGGLMHAANALGVKVLPLFARLGSEMQLTSTCSCYPLFDKLDVNNISIEDIVINFCKALNLDYIHPENE